MTDSDFTNPEKNFTAPLPQNPHPRVLAHLGDGVYELFVRTQGLKLFGDDLAKLHRYTTEHVKAEFQVGVLEMLEPHLTEEEKDIVRRGRNVPVTASRRNQHKLHRVANGFEALIGYLYLYDQPRLQELQQRIQPFLENSPEK